MSLFALLAGGVLLAFAMAGDNTSTPATAALAWLLAVVAPLFGAGTSVLKRMTRPLQISVAMSAAFLILQFLVVRAAAT